MATTNITQLRRVTFISRAAGGGFSTFSLEPDDLGQDSLLTVNITPRVTSRASAVGTSETPIPGTIDSFAATLTMLLDNFETMGKALRRWKKATYEGAGIGNGQITDEGANFCAGNDYLMMVCEGVCDDGSSTDVVLTRCLPELDGDLEIGGSDTPEVTLNLHPIIYNANTHADDGFPAYSYRFGDASLTEKLHLNATTGEYQPVTASETTPEAGA